MAIQTGFPITPVLICGSYKAWRKGSFKVHKEPVKVRILPSTDTTGWTLENVDKYAKELHDLFAKELPSDQKPANE